MPVRYVRIRVRKEKELSRFSQPLARPVYRIIWQRQWRLYAKGIFCRWIHPCAESSPSSGMEQRASRDVISRRCLINRTTSEIYLSLNLSWRTYGEYASSFPHSKTICQRLQLIAPTKFPRIVRQIQMAAETLENTVIVSPGKTLHCRPRLAYVCSALAATSPRARKASYNCAGPRSTSFNPLRTFSESRACLLIAE